MNLSTEHQNALYAICDQLEDEVGDEHSAKTDCDEAVCQACEKHKLVAAIEKFLGGY